MTSILSRLEEKIEEIIWDGDLLKIEVAFRQAREEILELFQLEKDGLSTVEGIKIKLIGKEEQT